MKPRRTPTTDTVFRLEGGNEDNDLWVRTGEEDGAPTLTSVWSLDADERAVIADGGCVTLTTFGAGTPPVRIAVTDEQPGR